MMSFGNAGVWFRFWPQGGVRAGGDVAASKPTTLSVPVMASAVGLAVRSSHGCGGWRVGLGRILSAVYVSGYRPILVPNQHRLPQIPLQNRRGSEWVAVRRFAPQTMERGLHSWTGELGDHRCAGDPQRRLTRQSNVSKGSCRPGALRRSPGYTAGHSQDSAWPILT
jgi:hypothetical protein